MIPDVRFTCGEGAGWTDLYAASGFTPGAALVIVNKIALADPTVWLGAAPPTSAGDGFPLIYGKPFIVMAGAAGCWVHAFTGSQGRLSVQLAGSAS